MYARIAARNCFLQVLNSTRAQAGLLLMSPQILKTLNFMKMYLMACVVQKSLVEVAGPT